MVSEGYLDCGYQYVNIDGCWNENTKNYNPLKPDKKRFPSGIKKLADYVSRVGMVPKWETVKREQGSRDPEDHNEPSFKGRSLRKLKSQIGVRNSNLFRGKRMCFCS